jgi:hypothetical protein
MRVLCYECYSDIDTHEQLWLYSEWVHTSAFTARFYIREDRVSAVLLIDPTLIRRQEDDYYI